MNRKLKASGALLCAALMVGALAVVSAPAEAGGHFVSSQAHTLLRGGVDPTGAGLELNDAGGTIYCPTQSFAGTTSTTTVESVSITPTYGGCVYTGTTNTVHVDMNGCQYTFTVRKIEANVKHNTLHLICPAGKSVTLTTTLEHSNTVACIIHIPPQTPTGGIVYTNVLGGAKNLHTITADVTVSGITTTRTPQFFGGCQFASEHATTFEVKGNAFMEGSNTEGVQAAITAT